MAKLLMLKGLPASGKSTHAKKLVAEGGNWVRVNKDDLRALLHGGKWSKNNEKQIIRVRDAIIKDSLLAGKNVVVDDTNFAPIHKEKLQEIAYAFKATFETKYFDLPVEICIKRDLERFNSVGEKVIRQMYNQYVREVGVYTPPEGQPRAVICDIDGTLAHMDGKRGPFEWSKVGGDRLDTTVRDLLCLYDDAGESIVLVSGRDEVCREETEKWLWDNEVPFEQLFMRPEGSGEKDYKVKKDIFEAHIKDEYQVLFVVDDRNQVVDFWRSLGLQCFQVAEGDF